MQCDNCQRPAIYVYAPRMVTPAHYCERHLPSFLRKQTRSGVLQTTEAYNEVRSRVIAKLATDPEPTVSEPAPEAATEESVPEEKPKRKRRPRKPVTPPETEQE